MRTLVVALFFAVGIAVTAGGVLAAEVKPLGDARLGDARLGAWLPQDLDGFDPWRHHQATIVSRAHADAFVYRRRVMDEFGGRGPFGGPGTIVPVKHSYAKAGVTYDYRRGIAFTVTSCCTVHDKVLAFAGAPPHRVVDTDLRDVHTSRGFALGDSVAKVLRINGSARLLAVPRHSALRMLSYAAMYPASVSTCGQFQNFIFQDDRLVYLELLDGC